MNSSFEWIEWVQEQTKETCETYLRQPDRLFGDLNREISYTNEYQGREVFELLQNANDAGAVEEKKSDVFITANEHGLLIANTGKPFDAPGVMSLMISDNSPKKKQRHKFIGNKGLGFRAVLNWSDCPFLISGDLALSFDRGFAEEQVSRLRGKNSQLSKRIDELENAGEKRFAPVLALSDKREPVCTTP